MDRNSSAALPAVDLRALALAAAAVTPFFTWVVADDWWDIFHTPGTLAEIALGQIALAANLLETVFGCVFVAVGGALFAQRRAAQRGPFSFVATALVIAGLIVVLDAIVAGLGLLSADWPASEASLGDTRYVLMWQVLSDSALAAAVAVAARLYITWRRASREAKDTLRFVALAIIALALALASIVRWTASLFMVRFAEPVSAPLMVLSWLQSSIDILIDSVGAVFLFGAIAIALLRRARAESSLLWVTIASIGAVSASFVARNGVAILSYWSAEGDLSRIMDWQRDAPGLLVAALGGAFYLFVVDREALKAFAHVPRNFTQLRQWPYGRSDDE